MPSLAVGLLAFPLLALAACSGGSANGGRVPLPNINVKATDLPAVAPMCDPLPALDSAALMRDVFRLAADSMRGRLIGSVENALARDLLAARFDAIGLEVLPPGRLHPVPVIPSARLNIEQGWNVVGMVRGTVTPERYIVVTAHYDHVGIGRPVDGDSIYNGADDNASGAAALAVLGRYFVENPPRHSIIFAAVDGEERGMWGSRHFVEAPTVPLEQIVINVNMDMIGRNIDNELYAAGPAKYPALRPLVEQTARCAPLTLKIGHDSGSAGYDWTNQSDQRAFHGKAIPFVYFGVEDHPDYHQPSDTPERLMPGFYVNAVRTVADFVRRVDGR
ncbi:MAG: M28 family peptidase [Gemmatimonadales bacterium]|nr:M28 family peptidase [Gemmatimonadales bacterium]